MAIKGAGSSTGSGAADTGQGDANPVGLNQAARDGKFEFVVKSVECGKSKIGTGVLTKTAQGQFCVITVSVKNIGDKPQTFFVDNQKASANGAEYAPDGVATMYAGGDQSTWVNEINPGNQIAGPLVYDVPAGVALTKIKLHDSMFSGGVTVTLS